MSTLGNDICFDAVPVTLVGDGVTPKYDSRHIYITKDLKIKLAFHNISVTLGLM